MFGVTVVAIQDKDIPRFSIVAKKPYVGTLLIVLGVLWLLLLLGFIWLAIQYTDSQAHRLGVKLTDSEQSQRLAQRELADTKQALVNSQRSEFISRTANNQIQSALAEKDEQIAGLKADLDFYERLVGSSGQRHGLNVHDAEFVPIADGGAWQYTITLTQNINRGGITTGQMHFDVDGVVDGKLQTVTWNTLVQNAQASGQAFSFRYFQQLQGNVVLPDHFSPQRVHVSLKGSFGNIENTFDWQSKQHATMGITQAK
jgi:hypothetical protein